MKKGAGREVRSIKGDKDRGIRRAFGRVCRVKRGCREKRKGTRNVSGKGFRDSTVKKNGE